MKFIHLTDPHVCMEPFFASDPLDRLEGAVASINADHGDAEFVVITGDLTDRGDLAAYSAFRDRISALTMPVHLLMGNHDRRAGLIEAFPDIPLDASGSVQSSFLTAAGRFVLLDTQVEGSDAGALGTERMDWLCQQLEIDDAPLFIFMHHPPFPIGITGLDVISLMQPEPFFEAVSPHKDRIRHLFFGHVHRASWGTWHGIPFSSMRALNHQNALDLYGAKDKVLASLEPPAYGVVLVSDDQVVVHLHDYTNGKPVSPGS